MTLRYFDLNIEEVLENWEVHHAIREIIANALDEQVLTRTPDIQITKDRNHDWHIRDFGRGIRIADFTLNENPEKLKSPLPVIGKFGVGLKDALATFHRRGVRVTIRSRHGSFRPQTSKKHGFDGITTLHIEYDDTSQHSLTGTDVALHGVSDTDIARAKALFLGFSGEHVLDSTQYGQILSRQSEGGRVYILGVFAAEEPNFLFSYNITSLTDGMKKRLNRERLNVGRTTYADRVKAILKAASAPSVHEALVEQVIRRAAGAQCDEMSWIEISQMALNLMHKATKVTYVTETELQTRPDLIGSAKADGYQVVVVSDQQKQKLLDQAADGGPQLRTIEVYTREYNETFQYDFVDPKHLTRDERRIFELTHALLSLVGIPRSRAPEVRVSTTTRVTSTDTEGVWDPLLRAIVIKRTALSTLSRYAATLLHEAAHAMTGATDMSREFEATLSTYLGLAAATAMGR